MNVKAVLCTFVLPLSVGQGVLFAQSEQPVCQAGDLGVLNGTFDCDPLLDGAFGWQYRAPQFEGGEGFVAEVIVPAEGSDRMSNYLSLSHSATSGSENYPAKAMQQTDILLGSQAAKQLVLRFDHRVIQGMPYEEALIVVFKVQNSEDDSVVEEALALSSNLQGLAQWSTAELYLDLPEDTDSTCGLECSIEVQMKQVMVGYNIFCDDRDTLSPIVHLDNFEIRVITDPDEEVDVVDGQLLDWCDTDCGGLDPLVMTWTEGDSLVRVPGSLEQDARINQHLCTFDVDCCSGGLPPRPRRTAQVAYEEYEFAVSYPLLEPSSCPADLNGDGEVGGPDLTFLLSAWGQEGDCLPADLDGDGEVGGSDLSIVIGNWGACF